MVSISWSVVVLPSSTEFSYVSRTAQSNRLYCSSLTATPCTLHSLGACFQQAKHTHVFRRQICRKPIISDFWGLKVWERSTHPSYRIFGVWGSGSGPHTHTHTHTHTQKKNTHEHTHTVCKTRFAVDPKWFPTGATHCTPTVAPTLSQPAILFLKVSEWGRADPQTRAKIATGIP